MALTPEQQTTWNAVVGEPFQGVLATAGFIRRVRTLRIGGYATF